MVEISDEALLALGYALTHDTDEAILAEARKRFATGRDMRGLPRPNGAPPDSYYAVQHRLLASGEIGVYLYLRWPPRLDEPPGPRGKVAIRPSRSLGRLN